MQRTQKGRNCYASSHRLQFSNSIAENNIQVWKSQGHGFIFPVRSSVIWPLAPDFLGTVPASSVITPAAMVMHVVMRVLTFSQVPNHLMVLVGQYPRQEKWSFVSATSFKAPSWPAFSINGNIPLALGYGSPLAAATSCWKWLLCWVMAGCIGVVAQLMDALHKFTLSVEHFLGYEKNGKPHLSYSLLNVFDTQDNLSEAMVSSLFSCR